MKHRIIRIVLFGLAGVAGTSFAETSGDVVISLDHKGKQIDRFFYDFKSPGAPKKFVRNGWAKTLLNDYGFNGIRTSIYGTAKKPAHPHPGTVLEEYYAPEALGLKLAKTLNPDLVIFASKKLEGTDSFPNWTKDERGVIPEKYAVMIVDYLEYMKREGLEVDVLGIDNERRFNEGKIMPGMHREVVLELRRLTAKRDLKMPLIIGHEDYAMGRNNWMASFDAMDCDTMDIFGAHYYPRQRVLDRLMSDLEYAGDREKWHTELHWDSHGHPEGSADSLETAVCSFLALWDCVDNGMNGLMWWDFCPPRTRRSHLMHMASVPLVNAWPVKVVDPDGSGTVDLNQLHTRAFLQGDTLTVYALNLDPTKEWKGLGVELSSGRIGGAIEGRQWADGYPPEGRFSKINPDTSLRFCVDLAPGTISVFSLKVCDRGVDVVSK